ncbi:MAG: hypothetical protein R3C14_35835 [Caldilineaceae bacterium]
MHQLRNLAVLIGSSVGMTGLLLMTMIFFVPLSVKASAPDMGAVSVTATHITNRAAPFIDGILEEIWQDAGKLTFPNAAGNCFTLEDTQHYAATDPSTFTVYYLHDDFNLYIAIEATDDTMVEGSDYDLNSDGLAGMALARKQDAIQSPSMFRLIWYTATISSTVYGPPIDRDRMVYDVEWRRAFTGTWNDNRDRDNGYVFEFSIPLIDPVSGALGLGGWQAGDDIPANIVLVDHDSKPGAAFDDPAANFRKCWWGSDTAEDLTTAPRAIHLDDGAPIGEPGTNMTMTATHIDPAMAPVIDGNPNDPIWQLATPLHFPNSVGQSYTPSPSQAAYNTDDPSTYTITALHDDTYLYISVRSDDRKIEGAAYDQAADGLISLALEAKQKTSEQRYATYWNKLDLWEERELPTPVTDCDGTVLTTANRHFQEGAPRYPYNTPQINWGPIITGTLDNNDDLDGGYAFEYRIPLTAVHSITRHLGGYQAGDMIPANIVLVDHDNQPNGAFDDAITHFRKYWWGFDGNEFYPPTATGEPGPRWPLLPEQERFIILDNGPAYHDGSAPREPITRALDYIASQQLLYSGLMRSYPDEMAAHLYDMSVALIVLTDGGRRAEAKRLATALMGLLEEDGSEGFFYDSYNVVNKTVGQGTASGTGPNTWAAFALAYYGLTQDDPIAVETARKVAHWVLDRLYDSTDGGVTGGVCHPFTEQPGDHQPDTLFPFQSTEQVIDTWHLLRILGYEEATQVAAWLTTDGKGWIPEGNRFATGVNEMCGQDKRIFLDPQSWGSIVANLIHEFAKADGALAAAEQFLRVDATLSGEIIRGFGDSAEPLDGIIWYGGTAQMIVAYVFDGNFISATHYLGQLSKVQNSDGSWNHSSGDSHMSVGEACDRYESFHSNKPHIGETAWNYFALRDVKDGKRLPYYPEVLAIDGLVCKSFLPVIHK